MVMDYERDITIDPLALDVEWVRHPHLMMAYGEALAEKEKETKRADERLKVIRAQLVNEATKNPDDCLGKGIKATAQNIEGYFRAHADHRKAKKRLHELELGRDLLQAAVYALRAKGTALENLVRLHAAQYFAGPKEPRDLNLEYSRKSGESVIAKSVRKNLNKRK